MARSGCLEADLAERYTIVMVSVVRRRPCVAAFLISTVAALLVALAPAFGSGEWQVSTIVADGLGAVGGGLGFAIDSDGNAGLTYQNQLPLHGDQWGVYYLRQDATGAWSSPEAIELGTGVGEANDLAYCGNTAHVSYRGSNNASPDTGYLSYAVRNGTWSVERPFGTNAFDLDHTDIQLDAQGNVGIGLLDLDGTQASSDNLASYAYYNATGWHLTTIASGAGQYPWAPGGISVSVTDDVSRPTVGYSRDGNLLYKTPYVATTTDGSTWTKTSLASGETALSMTVDHDASGKQYAAWLDGKTQNVRFATFNGTSWSVETAYSSGAGALTVNNDNRYLSMAIDSSGVPHILWYDPALKSVRYTCKVGDEWRTPRTIAAGSVGYWLAIDTDSQDVPHFAYYNYHSETGSGPISYGYGSAVPEPGTCALVLLGAAVLMIRLNRGKSSRRA
ncbi:hypothetical protein LLH03_04760 [bacterium]|nr:hypothetical protein [bacterium]